MIESKFDAIAGQESWAYVLQVMSIGILLFWKAMLYFINETDKSRDRTETLLLLEVNCFR